MFGNGGYDDGDRRQVDSGGATIVFGIVLVLAIIMLILVVTADFGGTTPATVPKTPGACAPFCPATNPPPP
jgi:hypothetical protein